MSDPLVTGSYSEAQQDAAVLAALDEATAKAPAALVATLREVVSVIAESATPVPPDPSLKHRLMSRVADYEGLKPIADVRHDEGAWVSAGAPGVKLKTLFRDNATGRTTTLVRMEPGARIPAHRHHDDEQCLVVRGDVRWREIVYREGDFVVMGRESDHPEVHTVDGNLLLIIAGHNEYVRA